MDFKTSVLTVGSCFSDVIGQQLARYKMPVSANPFGVIYNAESIHKGLNYAIQLKYPDDSRYVRNNDVYVNYDFHSEFSALSKHDLSTRISGVVERTHKFLNNTKGIIITYGTAWVYQLKQNGQIVANCHKIPAREFEKRLMTVNEVVKSFDQFYRNLNVLNNNVRIVLTVSPVRHLKDTLPLNNVSKSILRIATQEIVNTYKHVDYFPSFEIMMDDLRDYRFYKSDMIHPSHDAEKYIWQKFADRYFDDATKKTMTDIDNVLAALNHKPFHPTSAAHQQFLKETMKTLQRLNGTVDVNREIEIVRQQII